MAAIAFDTLKFAKRLKEAGVPDKQAEAEAEALKEVLSDFAGEQLANLTTRRDLKELENILRRDTKELETGLQRDMKELETNLQRDMKELETSLKRDMKVLETNLQRDTQEIKTQVSRDIKESELRLESKLAESNAALVKWVVSVGVLQVAIIGAMTLSLFKGGN